MKRTTQWNPQLSETHIQVTKRTGQIHAQLIQWNAQVSERHNSLNHTIHWKAVQWRGIVWSKDVDKIHLTVRWEVVRISGLLSPRALDRVAVDVGVVDADDGVGRRFFCGKSGSGNNFLLPAIVCKLFQSFQYLHNFSSSCISIKPSHNHWAVYNGFRKWKINIILHMTDFVKVKN